MPRRKTSWPAERRFNKKPFLLTKVSRTKLSRGKTKQNKKFLERNIGPAKTRERKYAKYTRKKVKHHLKVRD